MDSSSACVESRIGSLVRSQAILSGGLNRLKTRLSSILVAVTATPPGSYEDYGLNPVAHFVGNFDRSRLVDSQKRVMTGPMPHGIEWWRRVAIGKLRSVIVRNA